MKCEICKESVEKLYKIPFCEDTDEDGRCTTWVDYFVCSECVPDEFIDWMDEGKIEVRYD